MYKLRPGAYRGPTLIGWPTLENQHAPCRPSMGTFPLAILCEQTVTISGALSAATRRNFSIFSPDAVVRPCPRNMSSSKVTQPGPVSDGLPSLVLSKKYLACARPPQIYKSDHEYKDNGIRKESIAAVVDCSNWQSTAWMPSPSPVTAVQARYEPSDVFTPLVFEEIQSSMSPLPQPPAEQTSMWMRPADRLPVPLQHQVPQPQSFHNQVVSGGQRRPLQHLSLPAQSSLLKPSDQRNGNKPGDLSWLVNFQVASIFEPTCNGTTGGVTGGTVFAGEWQEPETLKQKKKTIKTDQKCK